jgi:hypothetical protein
MRKFLIITLIALGLTSCYADGDKVWVHGKEWTKLGTVVAASWGLIVVRLCDDDTIVSGSSQFFVRAGEYEACVNESYKGLMQDGYKK